MTQTDVARDQAAAVAGSAKEAGQQVAGVAKDEAGNVAAEATRQARDMVGQARLQVAQQAAEQQQRVAGGLRSLGTELRSMADRGDESGPATDLARQASVTVHDVADWLEKRDPSGLLDEVKTFARRRPGTFLAIALGAGLVAGRLTRGLTDETSTKDVSSTPAGSYDSDGDREPAGEYPETEYIETGYPATAPTPAVGRYDEQPPVGDVVEPPPYPTPSTGTGVEQGPYVERPTYPDEERR